MIVLRPFESLGGENHGWLDAKHHFSFANYQDAERTNWAVTATCSNDRVASLLIQTPSHLPRVRIRNPLRAKPLDG